jgi:hypothetical protein
VASWTWKIGEGTDKKFHTKTEDAMLVGRHKPSYESGFIGIGRDDERWDYPAAYREKLRYLVATWSSRLWKGSA